MLLLSTLYSTFAASPLSTWAVWKDSSCVIKNFDYATFFNKSQYINSSYYLPIKISFDRFLWLKTWNTLPKSNSKFAPEKSILARWRLLSPNLGETFWSYLFQGGVFSLFGTQGGVFHWFQTVAEKRNATHHKTSLNWETGCLNFRSFEPLPFRHGKKRYLANPDLTSKGTILSVGMKALHFKGGMMDGDVKLKLWGEETDNKGPTWPKYTPAKNRFKSVHWRVPADS